MKISSENKQTCLQKIFNKLQVLLHFNCYMCQSWFIQETGICRHCVEYIKYQRQVYEICFDDIDENDFKIYSVIKYNIDNEYKIKNLIYFLKTKFSFLAFKMTLNESNFLDNLKSLMQGDHKTAILIVPSSTQAYHSQSLEKLLLKQNLNVLKNILSFEDTQSCKQLNLIQQFQSRRQQSQKRLNRVERQNRIIYVNQANANILQKYDQFILVDDVVTTGSTMKAAYRALRLLTKAKITGLGVFYREEF